MSMTATSEIPAWRHPEVVQIMCDKVAGTAFRVGPDTLLSVAHVTHNRGCTINGKPFKEVAQKGDFVVLAYDADPRWLKVNCEGFKKDRLYVALGYAQALPTLTEADMIATGLNAQGMAILASVFTVIPGMSGGPILDAETGEVVGTVNMFDPDSGSSLSVPLKGTPVCTQRIA
jgi:V8-like Glu-specific endopeptidase